MNQETEKNINEAIDWLQETGASVQDFAVEQAPIYCREVVAWELWSGIAGTIFGLLLLVFGVTALVLFARWMKVDDCEPDARTLPSIVTTVASIPLGLILLSASLPKAIKATVSPRMVIVEHFRSLK